MTGPADLPRGGRSRRRWGRRTVIGAAALLILIVLTVVVAARLEPAVPVLRLPAGPGQPPAGPVDGTWRVRAGSVAGFRVRETVLGLGDDAVGRTRAVTGTVVISGGRVISASFRIDLAAIRVGGKSLPQLARSLGVRAHPTATFALTQPVTLPARLASGSRVTVSARGELTLNGRERPASVTISARRSGADLQVAGLIPAAFRRWDLDRPAGAGFLGSLADHGTAEFRLFLRA